MTDLNHVLDGAPEEETAYDVFSWLMRERAYQLRKFSIDGDDGHTKESGIDHLGWWNKQVNMYWHRAHTLTLENPLGRQAFAKAVATAVAALESLVRLYGPLPAPSVSSGENSPDQA